MRRALTLTFVSFVLLACKESAVPKGDSADSACRTAEFVSPGTRLSAATDDTAPRFAMKLCGPGELAIAGFVHKHSVRIVDLGSHQVATQATTDVCVPSYVPLPTPEGGYGEYCVIIEPLEKQGYSTFDLDFSGAKHEHVPPDQAAKLCGGH
jgi:hypothetical protein